MKRASQIGFLIVLATVLCGCHTPPPATSFTRPEVKIVDYADVQRRHQILPKTQFYRTDTVAICVHGFAGRTVTLQLSEQQRGLIKKWSQYIHPAQEKTRHGSMVYQDNSGMLRNVPTAQLMQIDQDYVVPWSQPPPGIYEVRVVSNEGIVQQASFSVSN